MAIFTFAGVVLSLVFFAQPARAAISSSGQSLPPYQISNITVENKNDFVLEPGKMEVFLNPGESVVKYISITSRIKDKTKFKVATEDFVGSREEKSTVILLGNEKSPYSFRDNLIPSATNFTLGFGDHIVLPVTISVPYNAAPGGYYASVIVSNEPQVREDAAQAPGARLISRVGVLFFIRVNGQAHEEGYVEDFRVKEPHIIYPSAPDNFEILFNNVGSVHLAPFGIIHITNTLGNAVAELPVDAYFAMPDSLRYRTVEWRDQGFRFGRYKATLELHKGYGDQIETKTVAFWVIPWMIVVPVVVGLFIIVFIIFFFLSMFELRRKK